MILTQFIAQLWSDLETKYTEKLIVLERLIWREKSSPNFRDSGSAFAGYNNQNMVNASRFLCA